MDLVRKAELFATKAHGLQRRKYTGEPYINHCKNVAKIVSTVSHTKQMLCGALLHDVVEDTHFTIDDIYQKFGSVVADLVSDLTDISRPEDGNRKTRKEIDRQHTARASKNAKTIKLADLIENSESIIRYDIHFARTYLYEKMLLLDVLKEGDKNLWKTAYDIVEKYKDLWI